MSNSWIEQRVLFASRIRMPKSIFNPAPDCRDIFAGIGFGVCPCGRTAAPMTVRWAINSTISAEWNARMKKCRAGVSNKVLSEARYPCPFNVHRPKIARSVEREMHGKV